MRSIAFGASAAKRAATRRSTNPAPALTVSAACSEGESSSPTAAAMPPCAQADEVNSPSDRYETSATVSGRNSKAVSMPAKPPPTTTAS